MKEIILTSHQRKFIILDRLMNREHVSYKKLSEEYFVSRSSIANDISYIKKVLNHEGVEIAFDNSGTYIIGTEVQFQKIIKQIILIDLSEEKENYFIDKELILRISSIFYLVLKRRKLDIHDSYALNIIISIFVMIQRGKIDKYITIKEKDKLEQLISGFNIYPFVRDLLSELEQHVVYSFSTEELEYLSYIIAGSGWNIFEFEGSVPISFLTETQLFIKKVSENIRIDLSADTRLQDELSIHLYQLLLRSEAKNSVHNSLTDELKRDYPALYGIVWFALQDFDKHYPLELSDDEICFIVIHFQAAIERLKTINKILLVCPNGIGASSYISAKIAHILPSSTYIEIVSAANLETVDMKDVAFIVSTTDLPNIKKKVIKVKTMVTTKDMKAITNQYIQHIEQEKKSDLYQENLDKKINLFDNVYFLDMKTREEVLEFVINQHEFDNNTQKSDFIQSIWESENRGTYLENGFVLPHGSPKYVNKKNISVIILNSPINWGSNSVQIVILLMVPEGYKTLEPVMKIIIKGMNEKEWFVSIMQKKIKEQMQ